MLFVKYLSSVLLLGIQSTTNAAEGDILVADHGQIQHKPIRLDPGKEYSRADLQELFDAKAGEQPARRQVDKNFVSKESGSAEFSLFRRLAPSSPPLSARSIITLKSTCPVESEDKIQFIAEAIYTGKNIRWKGHQNIDAFGLITIDGGTHGKPLDSQAEFFHTGCRAITPKRVCAYSYRGVMLAKVRRTGADRGVVISLFTPQETEPARRPTVTEFCRDVPFKGTASCAGWGTTPGLSGLSGTSPVDCQYVVSYTNPLNSTIKH